MHSAFIAGQRNRLHGDIMQVLRYKVRHICWKSIDHTRLQSGEYDCIFIRKCIKMFLRNHRPYTCTVLPGADLQNKSYAKGHEYEYLPM